MDKWPKHFISGKQFQKRPTGNPDYFLTNTHKSKKNLPQMWALAKALH
jgi:hypothetical protein